MPGARRIVLKPPACLPAAFRVGRERERGSGQADRRSRREEDQPHAADGLEGRDEHGADHAAERHGHLPNPEGPRSAFDRVRPEQRADAGDGDDRRAGAEDEERGAQRLSSVHERRDDERSGPEQRPACHRGA